MNYLLAQKSKFAYAIIIIVLLSSCRTALAPSYDKAIVDGMVSVNQEIMELFASASSGTNQNDFDDRVEVYNSIIGSIDALVIQARSRPIPKNKFTEKANDYLRSRGIDILEGENAPSATALNKVSETITEMRDTDKEQGVTATEVKIYKSQTLIFLDQALTYESFLKR